MVKVAVAASAPSTSAENLAGSSLLQAASKLSGAAASSGLRVIVLSIDTHEAGMPTSPPPRNQRIDDRPAAFYDGALAAAPCCARLAALGMSA